MRAVIEPAAPLQHTASRPLHGARPGGSGPFEAPRGARPLLPPCPAWPASAGCPEEGGADPQNSSEAPGLVHNYLAISHLNWPPRGSPGQTATGSGIPGGDRLDGAATLHRHGGWEGCGGEGRNSGLRPPRRGPGETRCSPPLVWPNHGASGQQPRLTAGPRPPPRRVSTPLPGSLTEPSSGDRRLPSARLNTPDNLIPGCLSEEVSVTRSVVPDSLRLNPGLLHCREILYRLSYKGSPWLFREPQIPARYSPYESNQIQTSPFHLWQPATWLSVWIISINRQQGALDPETSPWPQLPPLRHRSSVC